MTTLIVIWKKIRFLFIKGKMTEFFSDACASIVLILNTIIRAQQCTFKITQRTKVPVEETQVYVCVC